MLVVPTSRRMAPLTAMISGMRKLPPISMSWPREMTTSWPAHNARNAITVAADQLRVRHEHDSAERQQDLGPLTGPNHDSLAYLAAVLRGQLTPKGDLTSLDTNIVVMQILDAARESAIWRSLIAVRCT